MWQSNKVNSIPVPLGYLSWGWNGVASHNIRSNSWTCWGPLPQPPGLCTYETNRAYGHPFEDPGWGAPYPTWTGVFKTPVHYDTNLCAK